MMQTPATRRPAARPAPGGISEERQRDWTTFEAEQRQYRLAVSGQAEGQCACGAFRPDGHPPSFHRPGCNRGTVVHPPRFPSNR